MKSLCSLALITASSFAFAQSGGIGAVSVSPNPAKAGEEVKITIAAEGEAPTFCGMVVHFDDATESRNIKIDTSDAKFPVTFGKTFAKPGTYIIRAEGKKITSHFPCSGRTDFKLVVEGKPMPAVAPKAAPGQAVAACPEGWKMAGKPGKAGNFTCKAGKGAMKPADALACGAGLEYFTNDRAKQLGCRKAKR